MYVFIYLFTYVFAYYVLFSFDLLCKFSFYKFKLYLFAYLKHLQV